MTALFAVIALSPLLLPLLEPGTLHEFDMILHLERLTAFYRSLTEGIIPPTWSTYLSYGLGSPVLIYNWSLPYYVASVFLSFGATLVDSYEWMTALSYVVAFMVMFLFLTTLTNKRAALVGSIWYVWVPYRFNINQLRGAIGEEFAWIFWPGVFWATILLFQKKYRFGILTGTLLWALLIWSHTPLFAMIMPLWLLFLAAQWLRTKNVRATLISVGTLLFGLGIVAWTWIPILIERTYLSYALHEAIFRENFISWQYLLAQPPLFKHSLPYQQFYAIGWPFLLITLLTLLSKPTMLQFIFLSVGTLAVFLMRPSSIPLWEHLPLLSPTINFPQRFLALTGFCGSVLAALFIQKYKESAVLLSVIVITLGVPFITLNPNREPNLNLLNHPVLTTTDVWGEFRPKNTPLDIKENYSVYANLPMIAVSPAPQQPPVCTQTSITVNCAVSTDAPSTITVRQFFFPGWTASADGKPVPVRLGRYGLIELSVPNATDTVSVRYKGTPVANTAKFISLGFICCYLLLVIQTIYTGRRRNPS